MTFFEWVVIAVVVALVVWCMYEDGKADAKRRPCECTFCKCRNTCWGALCYSCQDGGCDA